MKAGMIFAFNLDCHKINPSLCETLDTGLPALFVLCCRSIYQDLASKTQTLSITVFEDVFYVPNFTPNLFL